MSILDTAIPTKRPTGRVILVDATDRALLIRSEDPRIDVPVLWLTPGGGCREGESCREPACRELYEETGIKVQNPGPCVWQRRHLWRWGKRMIDSEEHLFFMRMPGEIAIRPAKLCPIEQEILREFRWWHVDELAAARDQNFVPRRFGELLRPLLRGKIPPVPFDCGV
jgi:8-oxo-dGTP pyrophosphatase MutT (NUDIX family)